MAQFWIGIRPKVAQFSSGINSVPTDRTFFEQELRIEHALAKRALVHRSAQHNLIRALKLRKRERLLQQESDRFSITADQAFQDRMDCMDPMICSEAQLRELIDDAPEDFAKGYLTGIFDFRQQLSILTSRPF